MDYTITYYSEAVEDDVLALPAGLLARYFSLTDRMATAGANRIPRRSAVVCLSCV